MKNKQPFSFETSTDARRQFDRLVNTWLSRARDSTYPENNTFPVLTRPTYERPKQVFDGIMRAPTGCLLPLLPVKFVAGTVAATTTTAVLASVHVAEAVQFYRGRHMAGAMVLPKGIPEEGTLQHLNARLNVVGQTLPTLTEDPQRFPLYRGMCSVGDSLEVRKKFLHHAGADAAYLDLLTTPKEHVQFYDNAPAFPLSWVTPRGHDVRRMQQATNAALAGLANNTFQSDYAGCNDVTLFGEYARVFQQEETVAHMAKHYMLQARDGGALIPDLHAVNTVMSIHSDKIQEAMAQYLVHAQTLAGILEYHRDRPQFNDIEQTNARVLQQVYRWFQTGKRLPHNDNQPVGIQYLETYSMVNLEALRAR